MRVLACSCLPLSDYVPQWLSSWTEGSASAGQQDFLFDRYISDDVNDLLHADTGSRSLLSRLPFARKSTLRLRHSATITSSTDESLRSLLVDDQDAELFGEDSINLLLTSNMLDVPVTSQLPLNHESELNDEALREEEEALRIVEETQIMRNRERARRLALERGLITDQSKQSSCAMIITRSPSIKSEMSMISKPCFAEEPTPAVAPVGILPHMRPSK